MADCHHYLRIKKDGSKDCFIASGVSTAYDVQGYYPMDNGSIIVDLYTGLPGSNIFEVDSDGVATPVGEGSSVSIMGEFAGFGSFDANQVFHYYVWKKGMTSPVLVGSERAVAVTDNVTLSWNGFKDFDGNAIAVTNTTAGFQGQDGVYLGQTEKAAMDMTADGKLQVISRSGLWATVDLSAKTMTSINTVQASGTLDACSSKDFLFVDHVGFAVCESKIYKFGTSSSLALAAEDLALQEVVSGVTLSSVKNVNGTLMFSGVDAGGGNVVGTVNPTTGETTMNKVDSKIDSLMPL